MRPSPPTARAGVRKTPLTVTQVAEETARRLRRMKDPVRARGAQQYFKHEIVALGITTPALRRFVQEQVGVLRQVWSLPQAIRLCDHLLREPELEIRGAGILILAAFKREFTPDLLVPAQRWLDTRLDNWALVDAFCGSVLSPLLDRHPSAEATLRSWSDHERLWVRRAALVTLVPFARRGRLLDLVYALTRDHFSDPEDLMHKATGWLLREAGKTDADRLRQFLLRHGPLIPRTALRYAIERFSAVERATLLRTTRAPSTRASPRWGKKTRDG